MAATFLNVERAFDHVWNESLLYKLLKPEIPLYLFKILESFLMDRTFKIRTEVIFSSSFEIKTEIPVFHILC